MAAAPRTSADYFRTLGIAGWKAASSPSPTTPTRRSWRSSTARWPSVSGPVARPSDGSSRSRAAAGTDRDRRGRRRARPTGWPRRRGRSRCGHVARTGPTRRSNRWRGPGPGRLHRHGNGGARGAGRCQLPGRHRAAGPCTARVGRVCRCGRLDVCPSERHCFRKCQFVARICCFVSIISPPFGYSVNHPPRRAPDDVVFRTIGCRRPPLLAAQQAMTKVGVPRTGPARATTSAENRPRPCSAKRAADSVGEASAPASRRPPPCRRAGQRPQLKDNRCGFGLLDSLAGRHLYR